MITADFVVNAQSNDNNFIFWFLNPDNQYSSVSDFVSFYLFLSPPFINIPRLLFLKGEVFNQTDQKIFAYNVYVLANCRFSC
ncbi:MAG: hypothetical protein DYG84_13480 [Candidatus Brocadia sp. AMX3]|jgi:hypothetical protein|nr:hypothetical protein [Candidatus Brocadia fulgida]MCE7912713.1 hypothetical protein [Candidatus Brocadia sp. AMX3]OQZ00217.1 MAG: hypothetical protein B6D35_07195 [Candidatus Brocadia sp. UTAMX2]